LRIARLGSELTIHPGLRFGQLAGAYELTDVAVFIRMDGRQTQGGSQGEQTDRAKQWGATELHKA